MSFKKEKINDLFLLDTSVENIFINEYMASAPGDFVKVYMFARMYAGQDTEISDEEIAKHLGIDHEDVLKAWTYWERLGVIRKIRKDPEDKFRYDIEFISLREQLYGEKTKKKSFSQADTLPALMSDKEIQNMFSEIEKIVGKVVSGTEMMEITSLMNDFNVPPDLMVYGYSFCAKKKKKNVKYVMAVIRGWIEDGLRDVEAVEKYLRERDKKHHLYRRVFQALGFARNATEEEKRIMDTWFDTMGFSLEKVLSACSRTAGINSPNINYVNKILVSWHEEQQSGKSGKNDGQLSAGDIKKYYEALVRREEEEADARRAQVYEKVPRIKEIEEEISARSKELSKVIISDRVDGDKVMEKIRSRLDALNMEKAFLLTDNGFEMDFMDVKYRCPKCKDTGILETGERCQCFQEITKEKIQSINQ